MNSEHPFAHYIRILGKGRSGSRHLSEDEAFKAMAMVLAGKVEPEQLGAFLMLLRVKEETAEEVAGCVRAVWEHIGIPSGLAKVDLDWSSYAGKKRQLPWYLLAALLLAESGVRILMHGASGHTAGRVYSRGILPALGVSTATSLQQAMEHIEASNFAYLDLEHLCPELHRIIELRRLLGLRSPVHTIARMLNPFHAPYSIQGIFHPGYRPIHQQTGVLLGQPHLAVLKGEGGEAERNPDLPCLIQSVHHGIMSEEEWPVMFPQRHLRSDELDVTRLIETWQGRQEDEYGVGAIIGTVAICLQLMGRATEREEAEIMARTLWQKRNKDRFRTV